MNRNSRYGRGHVLAATTQIQRIANRTTSAVQLWKVESESSTDTWYNVIEKSNGDIICNCPDYVHRQEICKHIYAVIIKETS